MRVLSLPELRERKGVSFHRCHLYKLIRAGKFPKPIKLGEHRIAFVESEIDDWLRGRMEARDKPE